MAGLIGTGHAMKDVAQQGLMQVAEQQRAREQEFKAQEAAADGQQMQLAGLGAGLGYTAGAALGGTAAGASLGAWAGPAGMAAGALIGFAIGEL